MMDAKKAREIAIKLANLHAVPDVAHSQLAESFEKVGRACFHSGYLAALEGPEVKGWESEIIDLKTSLELETATVEKLTEFLCVDHGHAAN